MIYRDNLGLVVDSTGDGGDSCNFTSGYKLISGEPALLSIALLWNDGNPVRHPTQVPWNNPKNFTRDQATPLFSIANPRVTRTFFWKTIARFGFLPNSERDVVGSTKYPWPHRIRDYGTGTMMWRMFDFADFGGPAFLGFLAIQGSVRFMAPLKFLGRMEVLLKIRQAAKADKTTDLRQLYLVARAYGLHKKLYADCPALIPSVLYYWEGWRNQPEMGQLWAKFITRECT